MLLAASTVPCELQQCGIEEALVLGEWVEESQHGCLQFRVFNVPWRACVSL